MGNLSKHFSINEFIETDTDFGNHDPSWHISDKLLVRLETIRSWFNSPVTITSGYRTREHNKSEGGSEHSFHLEGKAADIIVKNVSPKEVQEFIRNNYNDGGLGCGDTFTHIDVRNSDRLVEWGYS